MTRSSSSMRKCATVVALAIAIATFATASSADETKQSNMGGKAPDSVPKDILPGVIKSCSFSQSAIFPGTVREVSVFIPAQYNGSKPACVYVKTDGYNPREKTLLETLIAGKEMPVTIGVFVRPGDLPATVKNTLGRRNRCFEYDGMGHNNVRFLVDELLPFVAKKFDLKLSASGNDRCIAGGSSGGITAFNAAWERPDAFSRVYANSGSFVAFRGGHEFPTLVRKFEAKPIRAYLATGTHDMENCAGDWFLLDQEMDKALRFSGYDYFFRIINGGHVAGYYDYFPEAMRFLWKDWPRPVQAGPSAPRVRDIILPNEKWQIVVVKQGRLSRRLLGWPHPLAVRWRKTYWHVISRNLASYKPEEYGGKMGFQPPRNPFALIRALWKGIPGDPI